MAVFKAECTVLLKLKDIETTTRVLVKVEAWKLAEAIPKAKARAKAEFKDFKARVAQVRIDKLVQVEQ